MPASSAGEKIVATVERGLAHKARGWEGIRFTGSTPEWQRRARLEALKQGFPLDAISRNARTARSRR